VRLRLCGVRLRLRLRRRRTVSFPDLPPPGLTARQSEGLAGLRSRLLRRVGVAHRGPVLDLGAGWGEVTRELARRSKGPVVGLDRRPEAVAALGELGRLGDAEELPFERDRFELVFCQHVLMWQRDLARVLEEVRRVLRPGGVLVAIEPDYGGMIEHPEEIAVAPVWRAALRRAGADPLVGRRLPSAFRRAGLAGIEITLLTSPSRPDPRRFDLLEGLELAPQVDHRSLGFDDLFQLGADQLKLHLHGSEPLVDAGAGPRHRAGGRRGRVFVHHATFPAINMRWSSGSSRPVISMFQ